MVKLFKKKEHVQVDFDVERHKAHLRDLASQKDPEIVELIQMLIDLTKQDNLVWQYNWSYKYVDLDDTTQIRIEGSRDGDVPMYLRNTVFYSCYYPELFVLNIEIKESQKRRHEKERAENIQKARELLENKLKAPQVK